MTPGKAMPQYVSTQVLPIGGLDDMMNQGMSSISVGTINDVRKMMNIGRLPGKVVFGEDEARQRIKESHAYRAHYRYDKRILVPKGQVGLSDDFAVIVQRRLDWKDVAAQYLFSGLSEVDSIHIKGTIIVKAIIVSSR